MVLIGREKEQDLLDQCISSKKPEFLVVYGRRRIGKTYLIKEYFHERFSFYSTGIPSEKTREQLKAFNESLIDFGDEIQTIPKDWFEAFRRLKKILESDDIIRDSASGKRIVFLDEVPWMDTARADFKSAFDFFWNSWGSSQKDLVLIVCGSATSWIIKNILSNTGGFYNRITRKMHLDPFNLYECELFFKNNGIKISRNQIIESYMIFGGIPYYLNLYDKRLSLAQNVDNLIFDVNGQLHNEYNLLFSSLFKNAKNHVKIIESIASKKSGLTRTEISEESGVSDGEGLTKALSELEQCGFIRKYLCYPRKTNGHIYEVIDPFVLFSLYFLSNERIRSWTKFVKSPDYYSWRGNSFEIVCLNHIAQIKTVLGISGIESTEYSWKSIRKKGGAQIDLLIDRNDDVINVCEMKYSNNEFEITEEYEKKLNNKIDLFREETKTEKAILFTFVSVNGVKKNEYSEVVQQFIDCDKLFII
ncbi:MAG: ATP-binding protein [Lachnospiraceae bacterium]|nr:ATP-binding protein [Lachnospiraceae bacterium]